MLVSLARVISALRVQSPLGMGSSLPFLSHSQRTPITEGEAGTDGKRTMLVPCSQVGPSFQTPVALGLWTQRAEKSLFFSFIIFSWSYVL